jgi:hypothetical protein
VFLLGVSAVDGQGVVTAEGKGGYQADPVEGVGAVSTELPLSYGWFLWDGSIEERLHMEGIWVENELQPVSLEVS